MPSARFSWCWPGNVIGAPFISACSLANAISEPEKVIAPIASPSDISIRLCVWILPDGADAERLRRVQRGRRHEHRGQTDQRVERRDELRQRRHLDAQRDERADRRRR